MNKEFFSYIEKDKRKKILLLSDDLRFTSGVSHMSREIVVGTAHHFNWVQVGALLKHPEEGKILDLSEDTNKVTGLTDASVQIIPVTGYGNPALIRQLLRDQKPDAIMIFTDPRYWTWLFQLEREIRAKIPIFYLNIWDNYPAPMYNRPYYESVDTLLAISKQTETINKIVLGEKAAEKVIKYVPHGVNPEVFKPVVEGHPHYQQFLEYKTHMFPGREIDFIVFFNSRNIHRKSPGNLILAYREFCDLIGPEKAKKCALVLHTSPVDDNGTDLRAIKDSLCDPDYVNIVFSTTVLNPLQLNFLYNAADVTVLISSNEGWGLSLTESVMAGTMIVATVTGGMQDQMRFVDESGSWINFTSEFPSNHRGTYRTCGKWAVPVFPNNISIVGSPITPYIFDDRVSTSDVAEAIKVVYDLDKEERDRRGLEGREWMMSKEACMTVEAMCHNVIEGLDEGFRRFVPQTRYEVIKVLEPERRIIKHKIVGY